MDRLSRALVLIFLHTMHEAPNFHAEQIQDSCAVGGCSYFTSAGCGIGHMQSYEPTLAGRRC